MSAALKFPQPVPRPRTEDDGAPFYETRALISADESDFGRRLHATFSRERFDLAKAESRVHRLAQGAMERFDEVVLPLRRDYLKSLRDNDALRLENEGLRARLKWATSFIKFAPTRLP